MSYIKPPPAQHVNLLDKISRSLAAEDISRFKNRCLAEGIRPGEVEKHGVLELLQLLDRRRVIAPGKYDRLLLVLTDIDRDDLVQECFPLERRQASCQKDTGSGNPPQSMMAINSIVTEKALCWLASKMGPEWERVGLQCLGITSIEIYQCKADNPNNVQNQIFSMLNKWRYRDGYNATYALLFQIILQYENFDKRILEEMQGKIPTF